MAAPRGPSCDSEHLRRARAMRGSRRLSSAPPAEDHGQWGQTFPLTQYGPSPQLHSTKPGRQIRRASPASAGLAFTCATPKPMDAHFAMPKTAGASAGKSCSCESLREKGRVATTGCRDRYVAIYAITPNGAISRGLLVLIVRRRVWKGKRDGAPGGSSRRTTFPWSGRRIRGFAKPAENVIVRFDSGFAAAGPGDRRLAFAPPGARFSGTRQPGTGAPSASIRMGRFLFARAPLHRPVP